MVKRFLFMIIILLTCSPPRDNPFDPNSPIFKFGFLKGSVKNHYHIPVPYPEIYILGSQKGCGDSTGNFFFKLEEDSYKVIFSKSGYTSSTLSVWIASKDTLEVFPVIAGIPYFEEVGVASEFYKGTAIQPDRCYLTIRAEVKDPDGLQDIDSVKCLIPADNPYYVTLFPSAGYYEATIKGTSIVTIENWVGRTFRAYAVDKWGIRGFSRDFTLVRVIKETANPLYPQNGDSVESPVTFVWRKPDVNFSIHYQLILYEENGAERIFDTEDTTITLSLNPSRYSYYIRAIDEFGNFSQSTYTVFYVISK